MSKRALIVAAVAAGALAGPAIGQVRFGGGLPDMSPYVGVSAGQLRYDESGLDTITPTVIFARIGLPLSPYLAVEGRLGTGLSNGDTGGYSVSSGVLGAGYLKGSIAITRVFSAYAVAGFASTSLRRDFGVGDTTDTGFSGGIGGDVRLMPGLALNFEWTHLPGGSDLGYSYDSNLISAGITVQF